MIKLTHITNKWFPWSRGLVGCLLLRPDTSSTSVGACVLYCRPKKYIYFKILSIKLIYIQKYKLLIVLAIINDIVKNQLNLNVKHKTKCKVKAYI